MAKSDPIVRKCRQFYCDHRGDRWCCKGCPDPCDNRCLNDPAKCGLVEIPGPPKPKRKPEVPDEKARALWEQGMTDAEIGEVLGFHPQTIYQWRKRVGLGHSRKRGTIL